MKAKPSPTGPEDEPGPVMMTQRRAGALLEALYLDTCRIATRLDALAEHFDSPAFRDVHNGLIGDAAAMSKIRAKVLTGEMPIVRGEDVATFAARKPLLAMIEANGHSNGSGHHDEPSAPEKPRKARRSERPDTLVKPVVPDDRDPWTAPVSRLLEYDLCEDQIDRLLSLGITTIGELSRVDDFDPMGFGGPDISAFQVAIGRYRKLHPPPNPPRAPKRAFPSVADLQWIDVRGISTAFYGSREVWGVFSTRQASPLYCLVALDRADADAYVAAQHPAKAKLKACPLMPGDIRTGPALQFTAGARGEVAPQPAEVIDPPGRPDRAPQTGPDEPGESTPLDRPSKRVKRSQAV